MSEISFLLNILITNGQNWVNFFVCNDTDKIKVGIGMCDFSKICSRVMAPD